MLIPIASYWEAGVRVAEARNNQDEVTAKSISDQVVKDRASEQESHRFEATEAYQKAYRKTRRI